jgi:hypothetical protein
MKARQLRTLIIAKPDPVDVQAALDKLRGGQALTAGESGVVDYPAIANSELVQVCDPVFDGVNLIIVLYVTSG